MAEEPVNLRFLGEQIKRVQGDVRVLKADGAQVRADLSRLEGDVAGVKADITRVEMRLDAFAEHVDDRFDSMVELDKSNFRILDQKMDEVRRGLEGKIDRVDAKIDEVRTGLESKIERVDVKIDGLGAKIDGLRR
jgi:chromosome segregation ATPase